MNDLPKEITDFESLCKHLTEKNFQRIYLIHHEAHEVDARRFASRLRNKGFIPMVAADFRKLGELAVSEAIGISEFTLVLAFDEAEMQYCKQQGVSFLRLDLRREPLTNE